MKSGQVSGTWLSLDGTIRDSVTVAFENNGYTAEGRLAGPDVSYVLRFDISWSVRQFLLFRDLDEPDLWLAIDRFGRWGEMNGVVRDELGGCTDVALSLPGVQMASAYLWSPPAVRFAAAGSTAGVCRFARVDVETLAVDPADFAVSTVRGAAAWRYESLDASSDPTNIAVDVAADGFIGDVPGSFTRIT